jgi:hypothetical protein
MSEFELQSALDSLARRLRLTKNQRVQMTGQFGKHLDRSLRVHPEASVCREHVISQAVDTFCDAAILAARLAKLGPRKPRRFFMRRSPRFVVRLAVVMAVSFALRPEVRALEAPAALLAQEAPKKAQPPGPGTQPATPHSPSQPAIKPSTAGTTATERPLSSDVGQHPQIEAALDSAIDFVFEPQPLKDAVDFVAQRYHLPIIMDAKALEDASIDTSTEVKLNVQGLKLRQALVLLFQQLPQPLGFEIRDGVLWVTTIEKINEHRYVVIYDCRDLIHLRSVYPASSHGTADGQAASEGTGTGMFDVPAAPLEIARQFGGGGSGAGPAAKKSSPSPKKSSTSSESPLIRVIQYAGDADDWKQEEGEGPRITEIGGLLVVNQTWTVHENIKRILADLRRMKRDGAYAAFDKNPSDQPASATKDAPTQGF